MPISVVLPQNVVSYASDAAPNAVPRKRNVRCNVPNVGRYLHHQTQQDQYFGFEHQSGDQCAHQRRYENDARYSSRWVPHVLKLFLKAQQETRSEIIRLYTQLRPRCFQKSRRWRTWQGCLLPNSEKLRTIIFE